jgi:hypothetical protein
MPLEFYIEHEELLASRVITMAYLVGVKYKNGEPQLVQEDFIEYRFHSGFWLQGRKKDID